MIILFHTHSTQLYHRSFKTRHPPCPRSNRAVCFLNLMNCLHLQYANANTEVPRGKKINFFSFFKWKCHSPDLRACFSFSENITKRRETQEQAPTDEGWSKHLAEHQKGGITAFADVHDIYSLWRRGIFMHVLKGIVCLFTFDPLKWPASEEHCCNSWTLNVTMM